MKSKKKGIIVSAVAALLLLASVTGLVCYYRAAVPDRFYVEESEQSAGSFSIASREMLTVDADFDGEKTALAQGAASGSERKATIKLWGILPLKTVSLKPVEIKEVQVSGSLFGIKLYTEGVLIVDIDKVTTKDGRVSPGKDAGLKVGDCILSAAGKAICTNDELREIIASSGGKKIALKARRGEQVLSLTLCPAKATSGVWRGGIWVRDSTAGIGTLTCFDPQSGIFAGLGHGIYDVDTGTLMQVANGEICKAALTGVEKGKDGAPGQLEGVFTDGEPHGELLCNTEVGVYGVLDTGESRSVQGLQMPIALRQEVQTGKAYLYCSLDGESAEQYEVWIERVDLTEGKKTKNLVIRVTDQRLLEKTGGIVQGMSGTPILQNGKLVGAVTHVFVNDAVKGYGIFAENMLEQMNLLRAEQ